MTAKLRMGITSNITIFGRIEEALLLPFVMFKLLIASHLIDVGLLTKILFTVIIKHFR